MLLEPWPEVMKVFMQFITLDDHSLSLYNFHFRKFLAFLNLLCGWKSFHVPDFSFKSLEKTMMEVKDGKRDNLIHQGLILVLYKQAISQYGRDT